MGYNFDEQYDIDDLKNELEDANNGDGEYEEVPFGNYEVEIDRLYFGQSKSGKPMLTIWYKIIEGRYKNSLIFQNQTLTRGFQIKVALDLLESLETGVPVKFDSFNQFEELIDIISAELYGNEYELEYLEGKNGFSKYKIKQKF